MTVAPTDGWRAFWPRFGLQRSAVVNRRRHAMRNLARLTSWYALDIMGVAAAMLVMALVSRLGWWENTRWIDPAAGGSSLFAQQVVAICTGLYLLKAYDEGDAICHIGRVLPGVALGLLMLMWTMLWHDGLSFIPAYASSIAVYGVSIWLIRRGGDRAFRSVWPRINEPARALFLGTPDEVAAAMRRTPPSGAHGILPVAHIDPASLGMHASNANAFEAALQRSIQDHDVDTTLLCSQFDDDSLFQIVGTAEAAGCRVLSMSRTYSVSRLTPTLRMYGRTPIVELSQPGIRGRDLVLKRCFDLIAASLLLLLLSPLLLLVALLVKRSSRGPVFFRQERIGYRGRPFHIIKFRSMCADAEDRLEEVRNESIYEDARLFKIEHDPRVTPLGQLLRRTSIDELPQLFNVLNGSMSLVGPRPPLPREVAMYRDRSFLRFDVKPGITGPWQVNGRSTITTFDEVLALESAYVNGWTLWRDFAILARTVPVVLRMEGAH